jgi:hypothetical protein
MSAGWSGRKGGSGLSRAQESQAGRGGNLRSRLYGLERRVPQDGPGHVSVQISYDPYIQYRKQNRRAEE